MKLQLAMLPDQTGGESGLDKQEFLQDVNEMEKNAGRLSVVLSAEGGEAVDLCRYERNDLEHFEQVPQQPALIRYSTNDQVKCHSGPGTVVETGLTNVIGNNFQLRQYGSGIARKQQQQAGSDD